MSRGLIYCTGNGLRFENTAEKNRVLKILSGGSSCLRLFFKQLEKVQYFIITDFWPSPNAYLFSTMKTTVTSTWGQNFKVEVKEGTFLWLISLVLLYKEIRGPDTWFLPSKSLWLYESIPCYFFFSKYTGNLTWYYERKRVDRDLDKVEN